MPATFNVLCSFWSKSTKLRSNKPDCCFQDMPVQTRWPCGSLPTLQFSDSETFICFSTIQAQLTNHITEMGVDSIDIN